MNPEHPLAPLLEKWSLVLGSRSPRRIELLKQMELPFEVRPSESDELIPPGTPVVQAPLMLARQKRDALRHSLAPNELLITADTVVIQYGYLVGKPSNLEEAKHFLTKLSGSWHQVLTSYTISTASDLLTEETVESEIRFSSLSSKEIHYYATHYDALDKAGAYGVQEWIGLIGVAELRGSYTNVVGLPTQPLYQSLKQLTPKLL